ncbi:hypothetical protein H8M03_11255 [Sphingomonas sabuli]|uniref:Lipoprotein n=1 Tax=Sphingomonas sabuli TaxID=2764186 RepID=A0A7G9L1R8_9SPHN|nr:hypothetical protein [Sphingomonas sabuli]QNM82567.1 hypothetical protein H8M03_11255 [Sphingomonas sabuli]
MPMRAVVLSASLLLAACGPKSLELPADPIERAATCGAVEAASARVATKDINADLSIDAIGRVLHFPMLAGAEGGRFDSARASQVQDTMAEIQDKVSGRKWEEMIPQCRAAYPASAVRTVTLPADRGDALIGCDELSDFLRSALAKQGKYDNELSKYFDFNLAIEDRVGAATRARAGTDPGKLHDARNAALATLVKAGPPIAVMKRCIATFG